MPKKYTFFSTSFFRGLMGLVIGSPIGIALVSGIRVLLGLPWQIKGSFWFTEPAWVTGALFGSIGFMIGAGAITDWWKYATGQEVLDPDESKLPNWFRYWLFQPRP